MHSIDAKAFIDRIWDGEVIPRLVDYIRIPNKSPSFDPDWRTHGFMDAAVDLLAAWAREKIGDIAGATLDIVRLEGRTPVMFIDIPGEGRETVLLYGHLDKQPEMTGWAQGLGPWTPMLQDGKLYGRGGADDGYAMFGALSAILALKAQGRAHARCVVLIEACEESGSYGPARLCRSPRAAPWLAFPGDLPGFRLRQLRSVVAHHVVARPKWRRADGEGPRGGRSLG